MRQIAVKRRQLDRLSGGFSSNADIGLVIGTPVMTAEGELPVEYLTVGDRIVTRAGMRRLEAVVISKAANLSVLRIRQGVLNHDTPRKGIFVLPHQPILLRGWRAKLFYASEQVMMSASDLQDGEFICAAVLPQTRLFQLCFADDAVIYSAGMEIGCPARKVAA